MPPGIRHAYLFAVFNALSFQIVLSSPMVLFAKTLGATATVLGIIAGMMPLLVIFQIPAAQYIPRVGYKRFVLNGWSVRVMFIFGIALVPLMNGFLNPTSQLALLLALLFGFNLSRGISSCAWLPWISELIPPSIRGKYLARDAAWVNLASLITFVLAAFCLGRQPRAWQFALMFVFSAVNGAISLFFLQRIPDLPVTEQARRSNTPVPWRELAAYPPFRKLVRMVIAWSVAYGGMTAFTVAFLKTEIAMAEGEILLITSVSFLGGLSSLWILGRHLDRLGSKPILVFSFLVWLLIVGGWCLVAGRFWPAQLPLILALQFLMGLFAALVQMSNTRLAMSVIPAMGRDHFFALFSVAGNLALGLAPVLWGLLIDAVSGWRGQWLGVEWNRYSLFFLGAGMAYLLALAWAKHLVEPEARSLEELLRELLITSPQRAWVRLWPRG